MSINQLTGWCLCAVLPALVTADDRLPSPGTSPLTPGAYASTDTHLVDRTVVEQWCPRLQIVLCLNKAARAVPVGSSLTSGGDIKPIPDRTQQAADPGRHYMVLPDDTALLYCDKADLKVSEADDGAIYHLDCPGTVSLHFDGMVIEADSASFHDGQCELSNARIMHRTMKAGAETLTLEMPIQGVITNTYRRPVPAHIPRTAPEPEPDPLSTLLPQPFSSAK